MSRTPERDYDEWLASLSFEQIQQAFTDLRCTHVLVKVMSGNQGNSKQQIYVGTDFSQTTRIPSGELIEKEGTSQKERGVGKAIFQAPVDFSWLSPFDFKPSPAPNAKLIYYPQYPEVRLSGFLSQSPDPPTSLLSINKRGKENRRTLLLGVPGSTSGRVFGLVLPPESLTIDRIVDSTVDDYGPFRIWALDRVSGREVTLIGELFDIFIKNPYPAMRLRDGVRIPYQAPNAPGYTLEALFGISPNGSPMPDHMGWELKALKSQNLAVPPRSGKITLMTPNPDGGAYAEQGPDYVIFNYGRKTSDLRWDFTGEASVGEARINSQGMYLHLHGFDSETRSVQSNGAVELVKDDVVVSSWSFEKILSAWKTKHSRAAYVTYQRDGNEISFGPWTAIARETSFIHFLGGLAAGAVRYDPGLNKKRDSIGAPWRGKIRHQFRILLSKLPSLYEEFEMRNIVAEITD